jgi:hypothetical protein
VNKISYLDIMHMLRMVIICMIIKELQRYFSKFVEQEFQSISPSSLKCLFVCLFVCFHGRPRQATGVLQPAGLLYRPLWTLKL